MKKTTHILFGSGVTLCFISFFHPLTLAHLVVTLTYAVLPDIDLKYKHRRLMHNIFSAIFSTLLVYVVTVKLVEEDALPYTYITPTSIAATGLLAYISHLLLDSLTKRGVDLFWPLSKRSYGPKITISQDSIWNFILSMLGLMLILLAII